MEKVFTEARVRKLMGEAWLTLLEELEKSGELSLETQLIVGRHVIQVENLYQEAITKLEGN